MDAAKTIKRRLEGTVKSTGMSKTVVVRVNRTSVHPKYHKRYTKSRSYKAHDEKEECRVGDMVVIEACRPLSKHKKWRVIGKKKVLDDTK